jgi:arabinogalactan oligomer/maltooligosaccharide transport system substrate-binding protein
LTQIHQQWGWFHADFSCEVILSFLNKLRGNRLLPSRTKPLFLGILAAATLFVLTACAAQEAEVPQTTSGETSSRATPLTETLTVWVTENTVGSLEGAAAQFEADTGIFVDLVVKDFGAIRDEAISSIPSGAGPDILVGSHDWTGALVAAGVISPVDLGSRVSDFRANAVSAFSFDNASYGVPYGVENVGLVCNSELVPEQPKTWEELVSFGVEIAMSEGTADPYHLYFIQTSFGAGLFAQNTDGSYLPQLALDSEGGFRFAEWLSTAGDTFAFKDYQSVDLEMKSGELACWVTGPWAVPGIAEALGEEGYEIYALPSVGGETARQFIDARGFFLSSSSVDPEYANRFLTDYIASSSVQRELYELGGFVPAHQKALDSVRDNKMVAGFSAAGLDAVPRPSLLAMQSVWGIWASTQAAIMSGAVDPREGWQNLVSELQGILGD